MEAEHARPDAVVSSPLLRARETAEEVSRPFGVEAEVDERLAPGATPEGVRAAVTGRGETVVVIGHEPDCGRIAAELGDGDERPFAAGETRLLELPANSSSPRMAKILVHITHGPEHPTRAALGFLVAKAATEEGHDVSLFLAGDAVQLLRDAVLDSLTGLGTGSLREHYDAIVAAGGRFYVSWMSGKARGVGEPDLDGKPAELAMPNVLVRLALEHDRVFTY